MKKILMGLGVLSVFAATLSSLPSPAQAQLFQNNNASCESLAVVGPNPNMSSSVACKNIGGGADFNGDGFVDCAAASETSVQTDDDDLTVILNQGASATSCSSGSGDQFQAAANYSITSFDLDGGMTSLVVGALDPSSSPFSDIAVANSLGETSPSSLATANSLSTGGFGPAGPLATNDVNWQVGAVQSSYSSDIFNSGTQRALELFDCNGDGSLDAVLALQNNSSDSFGFNVSVNGGAGLQAVVASGVVDTAIPITDVPTGASLAVGDFNGDGSPDVAIEVLDGNVTNSVMVCMNDGACGFTCPSSAQINLSAAHSAVPGARSVASADFNGDDNLDLVVTEPNLTQGSRGLHYYFGNGDGTFSSTSTHVSFPVSSASDETAPQVVTTGCFNNDNQLDTATTFGTSGRGSGSNAVEIVTSNGTGGLNDPLALTFTVPAGISIIEATGIDAADFDNQGGDDIIALASESSSLAVLGRFAFVFMNTPETYAADAGADQVTTLDTALTLSGACTTSTGDTTAVFGVSWSTNGAEGVTLTNPTSLTPTFSASAEGTYNLTLTCTNRCGASVVTDNVTIVVSNSSALLTQGGCVGNTLTPSAPGMLSALYSLVTFVPVAAFGLRRRRKARGASKALKAFLFAFVLLAGFGASGSAQALSQSFSTQTFRPAVDDSDYFAVYGSPTLKQRDYHFGLWLDYAKDPYEVGTCCFKRASGITDNLVTGNFLGTYGVNDWFNVGGRLPVYFINNIDAPILARASETRIDLGDFELDLKFKLLDREKKHVGLSIIPFASFPTATRSGSDFTGNGNFTGGALLAVDGKPQERISLGLNAGFQGRGTYIDVGGNKIASKFLLGGAVAVDVIKKQLKIIGETQIETVVSDFFSNRRTMPGEARLGVRYRFKNGINVNVAGGMGYTNGIGSPEFRALAGVTYTSGRMNEFTLKEPAPDTFELKDEDVWAKANVGDELKLRDKIYFDYDKATIRPISKPTLDKLALFLKNHPEFKKLRIEGNTCDLGSEKYNLRLSQRRAMSVDEYLVSQGVEASRLHVVGNGKLKPLVPNVDEAHREQNRRVQIFVEEKQ